MAASNVSNKKGKEFLRKTYGETRGYARINRRGHVYCFIIYYSKFYDME